MTLIGVYKSKNESILQLWNKDHGRPIFNHIMSRNRYLTILRVLRFYNAQRRRAHKSLDKLQPIREVFESWVFYLQDSYTPGTCMTVDEQLVPFRGRCPFRLYIPSKPGKYGIKIWTICDAASYYTWKMQIYTEKDERIGREVNQETRVVLDMVKEIEKTGRNITCDNFFTSLSLARQLLSKKLTVVGNFLFIYMKLKNLGKKANYIPNYIYKKENTKGHSNILSSNKRDPIQISYVVFGQLQVNIFYYFIICFVSL